MSTSPTHSSIALALIDFSKGSQAPNSTVTPPLKRFKPNGVQDQMPPGLQRAISMVQIRQNLMKRRDKLAYEKRARSLLAEAFQKPISAPAPAKPKTQPRIIALAPRPPVETDVTPDMSMSTILSSLPMEDESSRLSPNNYVRDDDIIGTEEDAARGLICRYSTGKCQHLRAQKTDGTYLNLCHMHRIRANANQRKLDRKKNSKANNSPVSSSASSSPRSAYSTSSNKETTSQELVALIQRIISHKKPSSNQEDDA
ncbi:hypothetical protein LEN26_004558 [Aphanomyces euteiches]|nr:hypothetical protein AeMF1_013972 [Aphanomyces euteiches]KAH9130701.1 hypothetical protein LEN26_008285 [Aphanomyces euteiches]KAH9148222.1 hypothetical protein LEN26_004558 [Aphanomyces euteiches]KAH9181766.1 hypothetical protein AeNC1_016258 [Aphanomyces euteiches]